MSFDALSLAVQAAHVLDPPKDDEFGLGWRDLGCMSDLDVTWVRYRSEGAGLVLGVLKVVPDWWVAP